MPPQIVLSHGLESGPDATKVSALAAIAEPLGFRCVRPDYRDLDATRNPLRIDERIARLVAQTTASAPVILGGSSLGAFISGFASLQVRCVGLFLLALPMTIPGYARRFQAAHVPTSLVHAWDDELCPVDAVIGFARARGDTLVVVPDTHRLSEHVDFVAEQFARFLVRFR